MPKRRSRRNSALYDFKASPPKRAYEPNNAEGGTDGNECSDRADLQKDEEKKTEYMSPKTIRFSQDTINYKFEDGRKLEETLANLQSGEIGVESIPKITVIPIDNQGNQGMYITHDNRRLYVFQKYEVFLDKELLIPVIVGKPEDLGRKRLTARRRSRGKSIEIVKEDFKYKDKKHGKQGGKLLETWNCPKAKTES